jgi:hypothetical protein
MISVCPIINRTWWRIKMFFCPWLNQDKRPADVPRMREVEDTLRTAIFDLREISRK